jgi:ATP-dependent Clp protease ATP-binding subunit ClpC
VLKEEALRRERGANFFIPLATLKEMVKLCDFFLGDLAFPDKALTLLDEVISNFANRAGRSTSKVLPQDVDAFFSHKYNVPAGAAGTKEKELLLNLEERIHEDLINQKDAVAELANAMRRARADIKKRKRTIGNFLFLGPTGVGKTETAKQLAKVYFGSEKSMIRLNMAEYQTVESLGKLIGDTKDPGYLTSAIREKPFSLILIDEMEKAHPGLLNVFLSIFDEGEMIDGYGRPVDFRHSIIIATSNAGAEYIKEAIEQGSALSGEFKKNFIDNLLRQGTFNPEFINRFDAVALYRPLTPEEMKRVALLMLADIQKTLGGKKIDFEIGDNLLEALIKEGFDPVFGGRAMRRAIQDKIENLLAKAILSGTLKSGDRFTIDPEAWQIVVVSN